MALCVFQRLLLLENEAATMTRQMAEVAAEEGATGVEVPGEVELQGSDGVEGSSGSRLEASENLEQGAEAPEQELLVEKEIEEIPQLAAGRLAQVEVTHLCIHLPPLTFDDHQLITFSPQLMNCGPFNFSPRRMNCGPFNLFRKPDRCQKTRGRQSLQIGDGSSSATASSVWLIGEAALWIRRHR